MLGDWEKKAGPEAYGAVGRPPQALIRPRAPALDLHDAAALAALFMVELLVMVLLSIVQPAAALPRRRHRRLRRLPDGGRRFPGAGAHPARRPHPRDADHVGAFRRRRRAAGSGAGGDAAAVLSAFYAMRLPGSLTLFNDVPPATTPRRCGFRSWPWRSDRDPGDRVRRRVRFEFRGPPRVAERRDAAQRVPAYHVNDIITGLLVAALFLILASGGGSADALGRGLDRHAAVLVAPGRRRDGRDDLGLIVELGR